MGKFVILEQPGLGPIAINTGKISTLDFIRLDADGKYEFLVYFAEHVRTVSVDLGDDVMDAAAALECFVDFLRDQGK